MRKLIIPGLMAGVLALYMPQAAMAQAKGKPKSKPAAAKVKTVRSPDYKTDSILGQLKSNVTSFEVDGIRVILKPATNEVISAQLFISGGVNNYPLAQQGIESLMLNVMADAGSDKYPREKYHEETERNGISISGSASYDYSHLSLRTLDTYWDKAWDMFQDVITHPSWNPQSFEQTKGQITSSLSQQESDPDASLRKMTLSNIFKNKRYEKLPEGTVESLNKLTVEDLRNHAMSILKRRKMVIVVVGKVTAEDLKSKVHAAFGKLPEGTADAFVSNPVSIPAAAVNTEERDIATNYIEGVFSAPPSGTREALAMNVAVAILADRLFIEVRTKRNLSYAPGASMSRGFDPYSTLYVTTVHPNEAVQVMTDEIRKIRKEGFTPKELANEKELFLTSYYMRLESNEAQAVTLGASELMRGWKYSEIFKDNIYSLTTEEVNAAFRKYASHISWYYLGKKTLMDEKVFLKPIE